MAAPLSQDLRRRLVQAIEAGSSACQAAARFAVSPTAVHRLMRRVRATGSTMPAKIEGHQALSPHAPAPIGHKATPGSEPGGDGALFGAVGMPPEDRADRAP
jgi:hypothetical protein